jgi:hypothetical protein
MAEEVAFDDRVQALPPELFNEIRDLVLTCPLSENEISINKKYRLPAQFHVSKELRRRFSKAFFETFTFSFPDGLTLVKWLLSLERPHRNMIRGLYLVVEEYVLRDWEMVDWQYLMDVRFRDGKRLAMAGDYIRGSECLSLLGLRPGVLHTRKGGQWDRKESWLNASRKRGGRMWRLLEEEAANEKARIVKGEGREGIEEEAE